MPTAPTPIIKPEIEKRKLDFKLGADPEFLLFHGTRALNAQNLMKNFMKRKAGLRESNMGYTITGAGEFGWDGAASTGELRPEPEDSPEGLTQNMKILIEAMFKHMPFLDYTTLSIGSPIGGHLHLDVPGKLVRNIRHDFEEEEDAFDEDEENNRITKKEQQAEMNRITKLLATFSMPIIASEHRISSTGRLQGGSYGKADDVRWDRRGDGGTIELRGLSAEWLTSEKTCLATCAYFAVIINELVKRNTELIKDEAILKTKGHIKAVQMMMLSDYSVIENAIVRSLAKTVKKFELYPKFKTEVDFILNPHAVMAEKEKHGWTLTSGWNLGDTAKPPTKKDIFSNKKIVNKLKSTDHVAIEEGLTVPFNDDYNVSLFAKSITDRIATLNWKLNNEYFLFGLRKGIQGYAAMQCKSNKFFVTPENGGQSTLKETCDKMAKKFESLTRNNIRIDPKTGKTRRWGLNQVIIGIPYDPRAENDPKELLELVWELEKQNMEAKDLEQFKTTLPDDNEQSTEEILRGTEAGRNNSVRVSPEILETLNEDPAN